MIYVIEQDLIHVGWSFVSRVAGNTDWAAVDTSGGSASSRGWRRRRGARGGWIRSHPAVTAMADLTAATCAAAAAAVNMSWPPETAVVDAFGITLTGERAGVTEVAAASGGTTAAFLSALADAVAASESPAEPVTVDRPAALTAVASSTGAYAAANLWVRVDMVARGGLPALTAALVDVPLPPPADGAASRPPPPRPRPPLSPSVLASQRTASARATSESWSTGIKKKGKEAAMQTIPLSH